MFFKRNEAGFSLVELAVVLAIISILIALIVPEMTKQADRAKEKRAKAEVTLMKSVIDSYFVEHGTYPKNISNNNTDTASIKSVLVKNGINWGSLEDPWGNGYKYDTNDTTYSEYAVYSVGPSSDSTKAYILATNISAAQTDAAEPTQKGSVAAVASK